MPEARLRISPLSLREANAYVEEHHRHSGKVRGMKFAVGAALGEDLVGVAIVGRPIAPLALPGRVTARTRSNDCGGRSRSRPPVSRRTGTVADEKTIERMLVDVGWGIGFAAAYDLLRPGLPSRTIASAGNFAAALDEAGKPEAAAAVRGALADFHAGAHRDPARGDGLIDGTVAAVRELPAVPVQGGDDGPA